LLKKSFFLFSFCHKNENIKNEKRKRGMDKVVGWIKQDFNLHEFHEIYMTLIHVYEINLIAEDMGINIRNCYGFYVIDINTGKDKYFVNTYFQLCDNDTKQFAERNQTLYEKLRAIDYNTIVYKFRTYKQLIHTTNYLLCLTFLLCAKKTFCRDIAKLIAKKILFFLFSFFLFYCKK